MRRKRMAGNKIFGLSRSFALPLTHVQRRRSAVMVLTVVVGHHAIGVEPMVLINGLGLA